MITTDGKHIVCDEIACHEKIPNHRWGKIKATWWSFNLDDRAWCPKHGWTPINYAESITAMMGEKDCGHFGCQLHIRNIDGVWRHFAESEETADPDHDPVPVRCHSCGAYKDYAHGYGSYSGRATNGESVYLCHPNDPKLRDCYTNFCRGN